jgi:hypothetical protein
MRPVLAALLAGLLSGCLSSYPDANADFRAAFERGDFAKAAKQAAAEAGDGSGPTALVWMLELGAARRAEGKLEAAAEALEKADALMAELDRRPEISLSRESLSAFTNPYALDYRGRNADRTMAAALLGLTHLERGDLDRARVAMTRALFRLEDAERLAARLREMTRLETSEAASADDAHRGRMSRPELTAAARSATEGLEGLPRYAATANPLASWLHGIFLLNTAEDGSDLERARKSLQLAAAAAPGHPALAADLAVAESAQGRPDPGAGRTLVYVLHENGMAPRWGQEVATLPLLLFDPDTPMVGIALPTLRPVASAGDHLTVAWGDGQSARTERLASVDAMMLAEFREEWPRAVTRSLSSATAKALVSYAANKAAREHARRNSDNTGAQLLYLATLVTTNLYSGLAEADVRHWSSLPKECRLARLEAPRGGRLTLGGACVRTPTDLTLPDAKAVLVTIRTLGPSVPPVVRVAPLQP